MCGHPRKDAWLVQIDGPGSAFVAGGAPAMISSPVAQPLVSPLRSKPGA
ncbi:MAG: hypothetical protein AVDCRST_MAG87-109 [uncultured Thermomicrobiales bacterium]|uniref:Uncharacterized protein n=1 Tax=uncultured Thermomicrobiales bacterium TaxID=1645740 RepID=A0A6J4U8B7_9BACT|nr:MAG: hypothetical protein AVDCRST_MAG87-109 [uncultured Thermomicrobiales bacterium]